MQGRLFFATDVSATRADSVAVISQAFAKQFWPSSDPLGKTIVMPDDRHLTVVGVVADTRSERFRVIDGPRIYTLRDPSEVGGNLYVRFAGSAKPLENAIRDTVKGMDPTLIVTPETMWESLEAGAESLTSLAKIILIMASIALLMAVTGLSLGFVPYNQKYWGWLDLRICARRAGTTIVQPAALALSAPNQSVRHDCVWFVRAPADNRFSNSAVPSGIPRYPHRSNACVANGMISSKST